MVNQVQKVEETLRSIKGVKDVKQLSNKDLQRILELEQEAEKKVLMGMARGFNEGLREVLKRKVVLAIAIYPEFRHPPEPTVVWVSEGEVVGEEITDPEKAKELRGRPGVRFLSETFVIFEDKVRRLPLKDTVVLFPPLSFPELEGISEIKDVISAWPTASTDFYIKKRAGWNTDDPKLGTMLIGFNPSQENHTPINNHR